MSALRPRRINVVIEAVTLRGFAPGVAPGILRALCAEVERRLALAAADGFGARRSQDVLPPTRLSASADSSPRRIGIAAGAAIVKAVTR